MQENGFVIYRNFFTKEKIENILLKAKSIFEIQFNKFKYTGSFKENMIQLFNENFEIFSNCGKLIQQGLIELYSLTTDEKLIFKLTNLGLAFPNMCTRPVLFFNHPSLAKDKVYYKTPLHQDWPSMQASMDSLIVWIPLTDMNVDNGSIIIYPKTHLLGDISDSILGGFASILNYDLSDFKRVQPELKVGDILIFSSLLVHESGEIINDEIRWSCHFRYTNMLDSSFIDRGFPNPYIYKPITKS